MGFRHRSRFSEIFIGIINSTLVHDRAILIEDNRFWRRRRVAECYKRMVRIKQGSARVFVIVQVLADVFGPLVRIDKYQIEFDAIRMEPVVKATNLGRESIRNRTIRAGENRDNIGSRIVMPKISLPPCKVGELNRGCIRFRDVPR